LQKVFDIIHPSRRNLTAIRGYARLGGLPDNPRTDPQDRSWFGPHDRLFTEEEAQPIDFVPGPEEGAYALFFFPPPFNERHMTLIRALVWCWGWDGAGDLDGPDVDPVWEEVSEKARAPHAVEVKHDRTFKKH